MNKILSINKLVTICNRNKKNKKKIVLCHGVFDLLHYGHILHFEEAKTQGDILVVSLSSSKYVNKGPGRPYYNDATRLNFLEAISIIDYIILNDDSTPIDLIKKIKPDIYCKGPDYKKVADDLTKNIILEKKAIKSVDGQIYITTGKTFSSSNIINSYYKFSDNRLEKNINHLRKKFNSQEVRNEFEKFLKLKVLVVGETIIDQYNFCRAIGKSGKEPIMVFKNLHTKSFLGGSAYIARNLTSFCNKIDFLTLIGDDKKYDFFINKNLEKNIKPFFFKKKKSQTTVKKRYIDDISNSKIIGVYTYNEEKIKKNEEKKMLSLIKKLEKYDLILITDFGHGMLNQSIINSLKKKSKYVVANAQLNAVNKGYHDLKRFKGVDCMTINESELRYEMRDQNIKIEILMKKAKKNLSLKKLILTRGEKGVISLNNDNKFYYCGAFSNRVVDKVGSGDCLMSIVSLFSAMKSDEYLSLIAGSLAASDAVQNFGNEKIANKNNILKSIEHMIK
jgi:rfaE bifunctional protein kinase chain/domain/rfaE bifunctional protein nucleotidyltransferase chain/domain